jgi:RNA polymerase-interacting CarD/CdnL/TRCF family regulator
MTYQIGDQIVHRNYGPGKITGIEEKRLGNKTREYYVVETDELTLWVPLDATQDSIRFPTPTAEFQELIALLYGAGEQLPDPHDERHEVLALRMKNRTLPDMCGIIRDLTSRSRNHALNRNDNEMMKRAQEFLLNEWEIVLGIPRAVARQELADLLQIIPPVQTPLGA